MKLFFIIAGKTVFGQMVTGQMSLTGMEQVNLHQKLSAQNDKTGVFSRNSIFINSRPPLFYV